MKEYKKKTNEGVSQDQYMGSKQVGRSGDTQYKYQNQNRRRIQQFTGEKDQEWEKQNRASVADKHIQSKQSRDPWHPQETIKTIFMDQQRIDQNIEKRKHTNLETLLCSWKTLSATTRMNPTFLISSTFFNERSPPLSNGNSLSKNHHHLRWKISLKLSPTISV